MFFRYYYSLRYLDVITVFLIKEDTVAYFAHYGKPLFDFYSCLSECMDQFICGLFSQLWLNMVFKLTYFVFSVREAAIYVWVYSQATFPQCFLTVEEKKKSVGLMECNKKVGSQQGGGATQEE